MLTYELPRELIAKQPAQPRDSSRLLVFERATGQTSHRRFQDLPTFLRQGDCLVLNDTKVLPARLYGRKAKTAGKVELLILRQAQDERGLVYRCLGRPGRRLRPGTRLIFDHGSLEAEVLNPGTVRTGTVPFGDSPFLVQFMGEDVEQTLQRLGEIPLPPYIDRPVEARDAQWYQTVYANHPGAVAAPTAGLHFTQALLERIREQGVATPFVTLHVGWGTFKPVGERELQEGRLHPEQFQIPQETLETIQRTRAKGGRVIAVGTTVVRALESWKGQVPISGPVPDRFQGSTDLFIRPPYDFKMVDAMITNFHLPGTSLLLLVAAFAGDKQILSAYQQAVREKYRFYSYGDAMLIV